MGEGNVDVVAAIVRLCEVGFSGFLIDDHSPQLVDDTSKPLRARRTPPAAITGLSMPWASQHERRLRLPFRSGIFLYSLVVSLCSSQSAKTKHRYNSKYHAAAG